MENRTNIIIAHRLSTILSADKIIVMDQGRVLKEGVPENILKDPEVLEVYLGSAK